MTRRRTRSVISAMAIVAVAIPVLIGSPAEAGRTSAQAPSQSAPDNIDLIFEKRDADTGELVVGAELEGFTCTRWENDLEFQCAPLRDYGWFAALSDTPIRDAEGSIIGWVPEGRTTKFGQDIPMRGGMPGTDCAASDHKVRLSETTPPAGYVGAPGEIVVCRLQDGWYVESNTSNGAMTLSTVDLPPNEDMPARTGWVVTVNNTKIAAPTTTTSTTVVSPTTASTVTTPMTTVPDPPSTVGDGVLGSGNASTPGASGAVSTELPRTGSDNGPLVLAGLLLVGLGVTALFVRGRRLDDA